MTTTTTMTPEMSALKTRLKTTWESGDYGVFAKYLEKGALEFFDRLKIPSGTRGHESTCRERFGPGLSDVTVTRRSYPFEYPFAPAKVVDFFIEYSEYIEVIGTRA
jgi:hypothetical protein